MLIIVLVVVVSFEAAVDAQLMRQKATRGTENDWKFVRLQLAKKARGRFYSGKCSLLFTQVVQKVTSKMGIVVRMFFVLTKRR